MEAAKEAVNCLTLPAIQELKGFATPHPDCVVVTKAVLILLKGEKKNHAWPNAQKMMANPKVFVDHVMSFPGETIDEWKLKDVEPILAYEGFTYENMQKKS